MVAVASENNTPFGVFFFGGKREGENPGSPRSEASESIPPLPKKKKRSHQASFFLKGINIWRGLHIAILDLFIFLWADNAPM